MVWKLRVKDGGRFSVHHVMPSSPFSQYQTFNSSVPTVVMRALQIANFVDSVSLSERYIAA